MSDKCSTLAGAASTLTSWGLGFSTLLFGASRRWFGSDVHPFYMVVIAVVTFVGFCRADHDVAIIDLQVPGGPPISMTGFDSFRPSPLVSPGMHEFLLQESSAFMASQGHLAAAGDPSKFWCKWCNDSGANSHIAADISEFTSNYRAVNINLTVAKQNISMQAVGIGDCLVHCVDNMGRPCKLEIKDVLHVPTASRNLLSSSSLAAQIVLAFPPGLYFPRRARSLLKPDSAQQQR
jgi:hypothetical protein